MTEEPWARAPDHGPECLVLCKAPFLARGENLHLVDEGAGMVVDAKASGLVREDKSSLAPEGALEGLGLGVGGMDQLQPDPEVSLEVGLCGRT